MMGRVLPTVIVVLIVLLAGCAGGSGDLAAGDTPETTDDSSGAITLVENRTAALMAAGSYTSVWEMAFDSEGERIGATTYTHAVDYENERSSFGMLMTNEDEVSNDFENFYAAGSQYSRYGSGEDATYQIATAEFAPGNTLFPVESSFATGSDLEAFSAVGTETYDGVAVTRYERTDRPTWINNQAGGDDFTWTSFDYVVLVDEDGLVRYESWGGDGVDEDGVEQTITFSYSLTNVGSTVVEDPDWLATAEEQSSQ